MGLIMFSLEIFCLKGILIAKKILKIFGSFCFQPIALKNAA